MLVRGGAEPLAIGVSVTRLQHTHASRSMQDVAEYLEKRVGRGTSVASIDKVVDGTSWRVRWESAGAGVGPHPHDYLVELKDQTWAFLRYELWGTTDKGLAQQCGDWVRAIQGTARPVPVIDLPHRPKLLGWLPHDLRWLMAHVAEADYERAEAIEIVPFGARARHVVVATGLRFRGDEGGTQISIGTVRHAWRIVARCEGTENTPEDLFFTIKIRAADRDTSLRMLRVARSRLNTEEVCHYLGLRPKDRSEKDVQKDVPRGP